MNDAQINPKYLGAYHVYIIKAELYFRLIETSRAELDKSFLKRKGEVEVEATLQQRTASNLEIVAAYHGINCFGLNKTGLAVSAANRALRTKRELVIDFLNLLRE